MKRNLFCIIAAILLTCTSIFAQNTHRVEAGDSFYSIAKEYGVTVDALKEANPNVKSLFVGMKINIPAKVEVVEPTPTQTTVTEQKVAKATEQAPAKVEAVETQIVEKTTPTTTATTSYTSSSDESRSVGIGRFGAGMMFNEGELAKGAFTMEFYFASRNYVNDLFFIESGLAYVLQSSSSSDSDYKFESTTHALQVPVLAGVTTGGQSGLNLYFGPYLDFTVASKTEFEMWGEKSVTRLRDVDDYRRFMLGLKAGAEIYLGNFIIGTCYSIGLTSHIKGADPSGSSLMIYLAF